MISDELDGDNRRRGRMSRLPFLLLVKTVKHREVHCSILYVWAWQRTGSRRPVSVTETEANEDAANEHYKELWKGMVRLQLAGWMELVD